MNPRKLLLRINQNQANVRFSDLIRLARALGFEHHRTKGSHQMFVHPGINRYLNLQSVGGEAKPYQVAQLLRLVEEYNLKLGEND